MGAGFASARSAALKFHWTPSTYSSHENGQTDVPPRAAAKYAKAFKVSRAWILTGEGSRAGLDELVADKPPDIQRKAREMIEVFLKE